MRNLEAKSNAGLLREYGKILSILKSRRVIRTFNNPVADYAEYLVAKAFALELMPNSYTGYDAVDKTHGIKYQIKARRLTKGNSSRQLSVIRNLEHKKFDYLVGILFHENFSTAEAYKIPHDLIKKYGRYSSHQNGYILQLRGELLTDRKVKDIIDHF